MKQTAVEWLIQDLEERRILPDNLSLLRWSIDKAKEMEKEQLQKSWEKGYDYATSQAIKETHKYQ